MFFIGDRVQAKHEILDEDGTLCAETGDMGVIVDVTEADDPDDEFYEVEWAFRPAAVGGHEIELWGLRMVA